MALFEPQGTTKYSLAFERPLLNAAGSLGFTPDWRGIPELHSLGAFFTNPVSLGARSPASGVRFLPYPGGFLLHSGYPNPGLRKVVQQYCQSWARQPLPVWVHLLAQNASEIEQMVRSLEGREGVAGIEVGLASEIDLPAAQALTTASLGELPVIVRLSIERAFDLAPAVIEAGASAVSLGPPRGGLPALDGRQVSGRLYGPGIFPMALELVKALTRLGIPVIGAGGVYQPTDVEAMLTAGAIAVQIDAALWRGWQG